MANTGELPNAPPAPRGPAPLDPGSILLRARKYVRTYVVGFGEGGPAGAGRGAGPVGPATRRYPRRKPFGQYPYKGPPGGKRGSQGRACRRAHSTGAAGLRTPKPKPKPFRRGSACPRRGPPKGRPRAQSRRGGQPRLRRQCARPGPMPGTPGAARGRGGQARGHMGWPMEALHAGAGDPGSPAEPR